MDMFTCFILTFIGVNILSMGFLDNAVCIWTQSLKLAKVMIG